jgi:hypothetical protein
MKYDLKVKIETLWDGNAASGTPSCQLIFPANYCVTPRTVEEELALAFRKCAGYWVFYAPRPENEEQASAIERAFWSVVGGFYAAGARVRYAMGSGCSVPEWART